MKSVKKVCLFVLFCLFLSAHAWASTTIEVDGGVVTLDSLGAAGDIVTITVTPDSGNSIYSVEVLVIEDGDTTQVGVVDNGDSTYSFVMPSSPVTVNVTFKPTELMTAAIKSSVVLGSSLVRASGSQLMVRTNKAQKIRVYGANGALVKAQNVPAGETFISGLTSGVYMVKLSDGTKTTVGIK